MTSNARTAGLAALILIAAATAGAAALDVEEIGSAPGAEEAEYPAIWGDTLVYVGTEDAWLHDPSKGETRRLDTNGDPGPPSVHSGRAAYRLRSGAGTDIVLRGLSDGSTRNLTDADSWSRDPSLGENVVAWREARYERNYDLYARNLDTGETRRLTDHPERVGHPAVHGDRVAWGDYRNNASDIYVYDWSEGRTTRVTGDGDQGAPDVHGDRVIYENRRNGSFDLALVDLATGEMTRLTDDPVVQKDPEIWGDMAVWRERNGTDRTISVRHLETGEETRIERKGNLHDPDIHEDTVVWSEKPPGKPYAVHYAQLNTAGLLPGPTAPIALLSLTAALLLGLAAARRR